MDRTELAWAAGFWDGEGSAYLSGALDRARQYPQARINQAGTGGVPEVLIRFQNALGLGVISGPELRDGREPIYKWVVSSTAEIRSVASALDPWLGEVKRAQFREILGGFGNTRAVAFDRLPETEQRVWVAGLWDGEGSVCLLKHRSHAGHFVPEASITQSSDSGRPEVLTRVESVAGRGYWYGPYEQDPPWSSVYRWKLFRPDEIRAFLDLIWPWIGSVKREQAERVVAVLLAQPVLPRGNPAWGSHKTHCIRGHEYETARVRPFRSRGTNPEPRRSSKQCLACTREDARRKRREKQKRRV